MTVDNEFSSAFNAALGTRCARCGKDPCDGQAGLNGKRFCHHDDPENPTTSSSTCFELEITEA